MSSSQDSNDNINVNADSNSNANTKRRRFSLTRSFSFSDTLPTKNTGSVSSFFKSIRKSGSKDSSTGSSPPNTADGEDYGSSWTYYHPVGKIVRVDGVDFEIVSPPPFAYTPTASIPFEPSEFGDSGSLNAAEASSATRRYSVPSLSVEVGCSDHSETAMDAPEKHELRRQASLDSQLRSFEAAWREIEEVGTYYRPESISGAGVDAAVDACND